MTGSTAEALGLSIKKITVNEIHLVVNLFDSYRVFYKQTSDLVLAEDFLTERLKNNESVIFVVLDNEKPIGFTQLYPTYSSVRTVRNWILNDLYVAADYRKQGIGKMLIDAAMDFGKSAGAKYVQLETATGNYNAQHLYESIGFIKRLPGTEFITYTKTVD
jgi:ribosomal protein S18 acetylase RimI-like enzyme